MDSNSWCLQYPDLSVLHTCLHLPWGKAFNSLNITRDFLKNKQPVDNVTWLFLKVFILEPLRENLKKSVPNAISIYMG